MSLDKYFLTNTSMDLFKSCWTGNTHLALRRDLTTDMSKAGGGGNCPPPQKKINLVDQKAPPGSGGAPHYYLPPMFLDFVTSLN